MNYLTAMMLAASLVWAAPLAQAEEIQPRISVMGEGRTQVAPDMATVHLGVEIEERTAEEAMEEMSRRAGEVLATLAKAGVAPEDVQTSGLSLHPVYERRRDDVNRAPRLLGFAADTSLKVIIRDLDALGGVLDQVIEAGANTFRGLQFDLQDPDAAEEEARRLAVADAMAKAGLLAQEAGVTRGKILSIDAQGGARPGPEFARMAMDSAAPVAPGALNITARVSMVFAIEQ